MSSRNVIKPQLYFCTVATVLCLYQSSAFGQTTVDLDKITQQEILPKTVELVQGNALDTALPVPNFTTGVKRQIQIEILTKNISCPSTLKVDYLWMPGNADSGKLNHNGSQMNAKILSKSEICTPGTSLANPAVVNIKAELQLDFPNIQTSGTYSGNLLVTVVE